MKTASHKMLFAVMLTYFIGVFGGGIAVLLFSADLGAWLAYIGGVAAVAVGFYEWKSKAENVIKLKAKDLEKIEKL